MRKILLALLSLTLIALADPTGSTLKIGQKVPDFSLTDQNSKKVSLSDFKGKVVLVTFLYTQCPYPEKCPMLAQKLGKTRDLLDQVESAKGQFQVISITLDPKRDTPEALADYLSNFDPRIIGLTGSAEDIARIARDFRATYQQVPTGDGDYTMDHTAGVFLFRPDGRLANVIDFHENPALAVPKIRRVLR